MEPMITLRGHVGAQPERHKVGETYKVSFRVANTHSYRNSEGVWVDGSTVWLQVECWRQLAVNVLKSISLGQPVVVVGRVRYQQWTTSGGEKRSRVIVEADSVGHDLARGQTMFVKNGDMLDSSSDNEAEPEFSTGEPPETSDDRDIDQFLTTPLEESVSVG